MIPNQRMGFQQPSPGGGGPGGIGGWNMGSYARWSPPVASGGFGMPQAGWAPNMQQSTGFQPGMQGRFGSNAFVNPQMNAMTRSFGPHQNQNQNDQANYIPWIMEAMGGR